MNNSKAIQTPLASHFRLSCSQCPAEEEKHEMIKIPYANTMGCLMYVMVLTRPDIAHDVNIVSRNMTSPGKEHWMVVKWIMSYLNGLWGYVDLDYTGDLDRIKF